MAKNNQSHPGKSTEVASRPKWKLGLLTGIIQFFRKASVGIWSIAQLRTEVKTTLDCWQHACAATDKAIKQKTAAAFKLQLFHTRFAALEPEYVARYRTALHASQRKLEIAVYEANYNFKGLEQQEQRFIKRLIKLNSKNFLIFHSKQSKIDRP